MNSRFLLRLMGCWVVSLFVLGAQRQLGPWVGLRLPVWDYAANRYWYLKLNPDHFQAHPDTTSDGVLSVKQTTSSLPAPLEPGLALLAWIDGAWKPVQSDPCELRLDQAGKLTVRMRDLMVGIRLTRLASGNYDLPADSEDKPIAIFVNGLRYQDGTDYGVISRVVYPVSSANWPVDAEVFADYIRRLEGCP